MHPQPPPTDPDAALDARLARWVRLARAVLLWERLWPLVLPPLALIGLLVALALLDVLPLLPTWLHGLVLAGMAGGFSFLSVRAAIRLKVPTSPEAARRLERDSHLPHRPLAALADHPTSADDPLSTALWQAHCRRMAALVRQLRLAPPHPNMAARDPWGLRFAVMLLLVIALVGGAHDAPRRLARALAPALSGPVAGPDSVQVWVTPPAYTGLAPMILTQSASPIPVPAGSTVLAVLKGGWGGAQLDVDGQRTPFQHQGDDGQRVEIKLDSGARLAVRQGGFTVESWALHLIPDKPPSMAFSQLPEEMERGRLRLSATAADDYGVAKAWVSMRRPGSEDAPVTVELPLPGTRPRSAEIAASVDLTAHPWAGLPVALHPMARDALGQESGGEPVTLTLPERSFTHPLARALVDQRRLLTERRAQAPATQMLLDAAASNPDFFNDDLTVFLALRTVRHALDNADFDLADIQDQLWNAALRLEDGDLSAAERVLQDSRAELEKALDEGASAAELQRLLDQFQQAMQRYLDTLAERMAEDGTPPPQPMEDGRMIGEDELRQMLDGMRDMAQAGARDALKQMLRDLSGLLDNLQAGPPPPMNQAAAEGLKQLRELAKRQQEMLDQTHRMQQGEAGSGSQAAASQEDLRKALAEAMAKLAEGMGEAPAALDRAGQAMGEAAGQLSRNLFPEAADAQSEAVKLLGQAAREAMEQMVNAGQGGQGMVPRDPLGRPMTGTGRADDGTTRIPGQSELQRSHQLLEEIRRRAGDWQRPEAERDYLRRLLKQF